MDVREGVCRGADVRTDSRLKGGLTIGGRWSGLRDGPGPLSAGRSPGLDGTNDVPTPDPVPDVDVGVPPRSSLEMAWTFDRREPLLSSFSGSFADPDDPVTAPFPLSSR